MRLTVRLISISQRVFHQNYPKCLIFSFNAASFSEKWKNASFVSLPLLLAVIVADFVKTACILATLFTSNEAFLTIGDAIDSMLKTPDLATQGCHALSKEDLNRRPSNSNKNCSEWPRKQYRRFHALFTLHWAFCNRW